MHKINGTRKFDPIQKDDAHTQVHVLFTSITLSPSLTHSLSQFTSISHSLSLSHSLSPTFSLPLSLTPSTSPTLPLSHTVTHIMPNLNIQIKQRHAQKHSSITQHKQS